MEKGRGTIAPPPLLCSGGTAVGADFVHDHKGEEGGNNFLAISCRGGWGLRIFSRTINVQISGYITDYFEFKISSYVYTIKL